MLPTAASLEGLAVGVILVLSLVSSGCQRSDDSSADVPAPATSTIVDTDQSSATGDLDRSGQTPVAAPLHPDQPEADQPQPDQPELVPQDAEQLRADATAALQQGDIETADKLVRAAMLLAPDDSETVFLMAYLLAEQNRFPEAVKMLDELLESDASVRIPVLGQTAEWMVFQGRWDEAEQRYRMLLAEVGDASLVERRLAQLYFRQGRRHEAIDRVRQLCRLGDVEEVELLSLLGLDYPVAPDAEELDPIGVLGEARYEISQGNSAAAVEVLIDSTEPLAVSLLGRLYAQQQDWDALATLVGQIDHTKDLNADAWFALGAHQARCGDHRGAVNSFAEAVLSDQTNMTAYRAFSRSLQQIGASEQAELAANRAELIGQTQVLGKQISEAENHDLPKIAKLADLLDQLQRPHEAIAWRVVRLIYAALPPSELQRQMDEINQQRLSLIQSESAESQRDFVLCGVDLQSLRSDNGKPE